jgi:hypothetical protein
VGCCSRWSAHGRVVEPPQVRFRQLVALLLAACVGAGLTLAALHRPLRGVLSTAGTTRIDEATILERLHSVAHLVTTEVALRDVVTYQNTRLGSTKRSLVVVTGKALVGFDLKDHSHARVDELGKIIDLTLPSATLVGIDVVQLKTYDESRGLWNPFHPSDRDTIYQLARVRLRSAAEELGVREHAEAGVRQVLSALFAPSGYRVRVDFAPVSETEQR